MCVRYPILTWKPPIIHVHARKESPPPPPLIRVDSARIATVEHSVLDVFVVKDADSSAPLSEERCVAMQEAILGKLQQRQRIHANTGQDPQLAEQVGEGAGVGWRGWALR